MGKFYFKKILFQEGLKKNVKISTDNNGKIEEIIENFEGTDYETKVQLAIPGIPNAHSHAFKYAMAGLTEDHS